MGNQEAKSALKPEILKDLVNKTAFTEEEIKNWYVDFCVDCPSGRLSKKEFKTIYENFFPSGEYLSLFNIDFIINYFILFELNPYLINFNLVNSVNWSKLFD